ncbi:DUF3575 domain-containing protein [Pleomorphovibrio marinus]|uniref:DUF3575 domain-containing protein n=1 Tax=Pleomorphovibrio marinus TaxID=2164132 RepID=UPI000E0A22EB|nr:DUF3575 domain-containing protein [Pleomorphovibrio marinus]
MKKAVLLVGVMVMALTVKAQVQHQLPKNEVKLNIFNTILIGSLELGYEHFIDQNQSLGVEVMFFDRFSYYSTTAEGRSFDASSAVISYNYYFVSDMDPSGFYLSPFLKYRGGTFEELDESGQRMETNMNSFMIGIGAGYKWVHNEKFAVGPYVNIARGFNNDVTDRFSAVEFNAGFSIGFRF